MMNPICFYHKADLDGVCSAAIVRRFVPECELVGVDYGEPFPWEKIGGPGKRRVYMVDFSLPMEDMRRLGALSELVWIDHHKTAIEAYAEERKKDEDRGPWLEAILGGANVKIAACELCWSFFCFGRLPEAVRLLGAYDSWRSDSPDWESRILAFQYGMRVKQGIMDPAAQVWTAILGGVAVGPTIQQGLLILEYQRQQDERAAAAGAFERVLQENGQTLRCICLNTTRFCSQAFAAVYDPARHDAMMAFAMMKSGQWKVSLYSDKPAVHCGAIASTFGGGGHRGAAGFHGDRLPDFMVIGDGGGEE